MAHFAELDENNQVIRVIVVSNEELLDEKNQELEIKGIEFCQNLFGGRWIQTSYNGNMRGKFAGVGDQYLSDEDIFLEPQPYKSWLRNGSYWKPPIEFPNDGKRYYWDEVKENWVNFG